MSSQIPTREELIDLITVNNMVEDFVEWLRKEKGIDTANPISLKDIDYNLLLEYVQAKGLLDDDKNVLKLTPQDLSSPEPEELGVDKRPTKPKKIRQKK